MKMLKGFILGALITAIILSLVLTATAESTYKQITVDYNGIKIYIDGVRVEPKDVNGNAVEPFIYNGTTYLPIRAIGEAVGYDVTYNSDINTAMLLKKSTNTATSPSSSPSPPPSPSPSPAALDTYLRNSLISRANTVLKSANEQAQEYRDILNDCLARGMARSSYAQEYQNKLSAVNKDITDIQTLRTSIQNATTNDQLRQYESVLLNYEAVY